MMVKLCDVFNYAMETFVYVDAQHTFVFTINYMENCLMYVKKVHMLGHALHRLLSRNASYSKNTVKQLLFSELYATTVQSNMNVFST